MVTLYHGLSVSRTIIIVIIIVLFLITTIIIIWGWRMYFLINSTFF